MSALPARRALAAPITLPMSAGPLAPTSATSALTEAAERYRRVKQIIDQRLTPLQREILERRETREEAFEEIAATLNMQPAAVRMQLSRARKLIREVYYEQSGIR